MYAALYGRTATAAELVRLGADINAKDNVRIRCSCARGPRRARLRGVRSALPLPGCARLGGRSAADMLTDGARCAVRQHRP